MVNDGNSQTQPRRALKRNLAWELSNAARRALKRTPFITRLYIVY